MSVLIKGMTMPKKCGDCPCMDVEQSCCGITFDDVSSLQISMQGNCPLVEVPEGEMFEVKNGVLYKVEVKIQQGNVVKIPVIDILDARDGEA